MQRKKKIALALILSLTFSLLFLIFGAKPLSIEYQFTPNWNIDIQGASTNDDENAVALPFRLGQTIGYFTSDGKIISRTTFPFRASISHSYFAPYNADAKNTDFFFPNETKCGTIAEAGFPFFDDERIYVFLPGGGAVAKYSASSNKIWQYSNTSPITAFSSSERGTVLGFADGSVTVISHDGKITNEFSPGGSDFPIILGAALSQDAQMVATISGRNPTRFSLTKKEGDASKIIFHEFIDDKMPTQEVVKFNKNCSHVYYGFTNTLGVLNIEKLKQRHIPLHGSLVSLKESSGLIFALAKEQNTYTVYAIESFDAVIASFSFTAEYAFIETDESSLYVGKDSSISKIALSKK